MLMPLVLYIGLWFNLNVAFLVLPMQEMFLLVALYILYSTSDRWV